MLSIKSAEQDAIRAQARDEIYRLLTADVEPTADPEPTPPDMATLLKECEALGIRTKAAPPVQVSTFEC